MNTTLTWDDVLKEIGVTRNTIYLWEKANKIPKARRDRNGTRIFTPEWVQACVAFRDKTVDPNQEKK